MHSLKWSSPRIIAPLISPSVHLHQCTGYFKGVECTQKDSVILTTYTHQTESSHSLIGSPFLSKWVSMVKLRSWSWADWKFVTLRVGRPSALNTVTEYPDDGVILTRRCVTLIAIFQNLRPNIRVVNWITKIMVSFCYLRLYLAISRDINSLRTCPPYIWSLLKKSWLHVRERKIARAQDSSFPLLSVHNLTGQYANQAALGARPVTNPT